MHSANDSADAVVSPARLRIREAIRAVEHQGLPLTNENVRKQAGGGSFTTIAEEIRRYKGRALQESPVGLVVRTQELALDLLHIARTTGESLEEAGSGARTLELATEAIEFMRVKEQEGSYLRQALSAAVSLAEQLQQQVLVLQDQCARQEREVVRLTEELARAARLGREEGQRAYANFDSVAKRMMLLVDQNKQLTAEPLRIERDKNHMLSQELTAYRQQTNELQATVRAQAEQIKLLLRNRDDDDE